MRQSGSTASFLLLILQDRRDDHADEHERREANQAGHRQPAEHAHHAANDRDEYEQPQNQCHRQQEDGRRTAAPLPPVSSVGQDPSD